MLPQEIGNLVNLKMLRLSFYSKLGLIPASIGRLGQLCFLDITGCVSLGYLPEEIGDLDNLEKLHMTDCSRCKLPESVTNLQNLTSVVCDNKTAASWALFKPSLPKLHIKEVDVKAYLFSGGAVGDVLQEVLEAAVETTLKTQDSRSTLESNRQTWESLADQVKKIKQSSEVLNSSTRDQLQVRGQSSERSSSVHMQTQTAERDLVDSLTKLRDWMGDHVIVFTGLCSPPKPEFTVGLDEPLNKLKIELLKGGNVSVHVLTGMAGLGKTTLAVKLCWDDQVKGMFGENIFFVTVSKTPNLKSIVQTLFLHCGRQVPEFKSDEDAIEQLGLLLRQVKDRGSQILLVLDDVWPGSEALVEKFKMQMKDYKILVTSRVAFPSFGTAFHLKPLDHCTGPTSGSPYARYAPSDVRGRHPPDDAAHTDTRRVPALITDLGHVPQSQRNLR